MRKLIACLAGGVCIATGAVWHGLQTEQAVTPSPVVTAAAAPEIETPTPEREEFLPLPFPTTGYSGTLEDRAAAADATIELPPGPPRIVLPRWYTTATDSQLNNVSAQLSGSRCYTDAMVRLWQLANPEWECTVEYDGTKNWQMVTRFDAQPERLRRLVLSAFERSNGVARQNLIFQTAITLPPEQARDWLWEVTRSGDHADYTDAMCALAFSGDTSAIGWFDTLPVTTTNCRRLVNLAQDHDALAKAGEREFLRSYRCIETLDCRPYFHQHCFAFQRGPISRFPWAHRGHFERTTDDTLIARLLPAWIRHFDGHPGSDDMAWRMCLLNERADNFVEAARWASRCTTLPDQDMLRSGTRELLELIETRVDLYDLELLLDGHDYDRNRNLIRYVVARRKAAISYELGLLEMRKLEGTEPGLPIVAAWESRFAHPPPKGIDSGETPLSATDSLRIVRGGFTDGTHHNPEHPWRNDRHYEKKDRLNPPQEVIDMRLSRLGEQFRAWETLAELEERRDAAFGAERADLEYKIAAVLYHEPATLYPCYGVYTLVWSGIPDAAREDGAWCEGAFGLRRAANLFENLARDHPNYAGRDKALFSAGMANFKLFKLRCYNGPENNLEEGIRLFKRCIAEHPDSTLSDDAARAVDFWQRYSGY